MLEQVAQHDAARLLIGLEADELHPLVGGAHGALGQQPPDLIGLLAVGSSEPFPDLLLTRMVAGDRKGRELVEAHAVLGIDFAKRRRDRGQSQALLYDLDADPEGDGDLVLVETLRPQRLERPELVERMGRGARLVLPTIGTRGWGE